MAACSVVNVPDDPVDPETASSLSVASGGSGGSVESGGGAENGGMGGTGGSPPVCGNMVVEGDEDCDGGMETAACNADCTTSACADGKVNRAAGEECDDGNPVGGDACSPTCKALPFNIGGVFGAGLSGLTAPLGATITRDADNNENFGVVWSRYSQPNDAYEALTSVYTRNGLALLTAEPVSSTIDGRGMSVAHNSEGRAVAVWHSSGTTPELYFRVMDPDGSPTNAAPAVLSNAAPGFFPAVGASPDGGFCIAWIDATNNNVWVRTMNNDAVLTGANQMLEPASVANLSGEIFGALSVIGIKNGYVVTYLNANGEGRGQVIALNGVPQGGPFEIWSNGIGGHFGSGIGTSADTSFTIASAARGSYGSMLNSDYVVSRRFQSAGNPVAAEVPFGSLTQMQLSPWITQRPGGGPALVTWTQVVQGMPEACDLLMRPLDADGLPVGMERAVYTPPAGACPYFGRAVANSAGDVFVPFLEFFIDGTTLSRARAIIFRRLLE